jgi:hypothetical protein
VPATRACRIMSTPRRAKHLSSIARKLQYGKEGFVGADLATPGKVRQMLEQLLGPHESFVLAVQGIRHSQHSKEEALSPP